MQLTFKNENGVIIFDIIGYEFDLHEIDRDDNKYDANWLSVRIKRGDETFTHPCLLTTEIKEIVSFLSGETNSYLLDFMEPEFSFRYCQASDEYSIILKYSLSNKWAVGDTKSGAEPYVFQPKRGVDARKNLLEYFQNVLQTFPER